MAKMYRKCDLKFDNGYIVDDDMNVVALPTGVGEMFNDLETTLQKMDYLDKQPEGCKEPSLDGFERKSSFTEFTIEVDTPLMDAKVEEGRKILEEIRRSEVGAAASKLVDKYHDVFEFLDGDRFVEGDKVVRLDLCILGDPLKTTPDDVVKIICDYGGLTGFSL